MQKPGNKRVAAVLGIAAGFGIEILDVEYGIDDYVVWRHSNEDRERRSKIMADKIRCGNVWYSLDEFMKGDI